MSNLVEVICAGCGEKRMVQGNSRPLPKRCRKCSLAINKKMLWEGTRGFIDPAVYRKEQECNVPMTKENQQAMFNEMDRRGMERVVNDYDFVTDSAKVDMKPVS